MEYKTGKTKVTQATLKKHISRDDFWTCDGERHEIGMVAGLFYEVSGSKTSGYVATIFFGGNEIACDHRNSKDHAIAAVAQASIQDYGDEIEYLI